ncbi:hypothetical protein [Corynebacterium sp.]|uniref:hypothetical protein n=1 Tax=Corynebacterium sp. TaxID=1720 RepID=UPI0026DCEAD0|nr:hypothetical protein [Corynebacterium sp.]MDO5033096.1 hypothetical protein [Corynebacterium sp.]
MTFGSPQPNFSQPNPSQPGPGQPPLQDYRYGQVAEATYGKRRAADMKAAWAPWPLKIAAVLCAGVAAYAAYYVCYLIDYERGVVDPNRLERLSTEFGSLIAVLVLVACVFIVYLLHAQNFARVGLSVLCALVVLLIPVTNVWPASLVCLAAIVAMWLPANREWFGGAAKR